MITGDGIGSLNVWDLRKIEVALQIRSLHKTHENKGILGIGVSVDGLIASCGGDGMVNFLH